MILKQNKLVRDKVLKLLLQEGYSYESDLYIGHSEYRKALAGKMIEDLHLLLDVGIRDTQLDKLADIQELLYAFAVDCDVSKNALESRRAEKVKEKGGYSEGIKLISIDDGSDLEN